MCITGRPPELQVVVDRVVVGLKTSVISKMLDKKNDDRILSFENLFVIVHRTLSILAFLTSTRALLRFRLCGQTTIPVKFDLIQPVLPFGEFLNRAGVHRFYES